jgi:hypothetical protein
MEVTNIKMQEMWEDVTRRVNALGVCLRTEAEVKNKWRNISRGAKGKLKFPFHSLEAFEVLLSAIFWQ